MTEARDDCVFCGIVSGAMPASTVHEDADLLAFLDIRPVTTGHLLATPKNHSTGLADLDESTGAAMWRLAHRLTRVLRRSTVRCDQLLPRGRRTGRAEVWHVHLHVIPRFAGDGFGVRRTDWRVRARAELVATGAAVRAALS